MAPLFPGHVDSHDTTRVSSCSASSSVSRYVIFAAVTLVVRKRDPRRAHPYGTDVGPVFASEAVSVSGWRVRDSIDQLVARIVLVEATGREVSVKLRNMEEQLVIANTKVTTLRKEADSFRDHAPRWLLPRRQDSERRVDRSYDYDDYDRADRGRDNYRENALYCVFVMPLKNVVAPRFTPTVMIRMVTTIAPMITVVGRVACRE